LFSSAAKTITGKILLSIFCGASTDYTELFLKVTELQIEVQLVGAIFSGLGETFVKF
jgi:hypothetical protein